VAYTQPNYVTDCYKNSTINLSGMITPPNPFKPAVRLSGIPSDS
jgi:hypothetical protein